MNDQTLARFYPLPNYRTPLHPPEPDPKDIPADLALRMAIKLHLLAALAWDYADTVINWAGKAMNQQETKQLSRQIRQLRSDHDRLRSRTVDDETVHKEFGLAMLFENICADHLSKLRFGLCNELRKTFPDLSEKSFTLLMAVQELLTLTDAMKLYADECDVTIRTYGMYQHSILCDQLAQLARLAPGFAGDRYFHPEARRLTAKILLNELKRIDLFQTNEPT